MPRWPLPSYHTDGQPRLCGTVGGTHNIIRLVINDANITNLSRTNLCNLSNLFWINWYCCGTIFECVRPRASHERSCPPGTIVWYDSSGRPGVCQQWGLRWATFQVWTVISEYRVYSGFRLRPKTVELPPEKLIRSGPTGSGR